MSQVLETEESHDVAGVWVDGVFHLVLTERHTHHDRDQRPAAAENCWPVARRQVMQGQFLDALAIAVEAACRPDRPESAEMDLRYLLWPEGGAFVVQEQPSWSGWLEPR